MKWDLGPGFCWCPPVANPTSRPHTVGPGSGEETEGIIPLSQTCLKRINFNYQHERFALLAMSSVSWRETEGESEGERQRERDRGRE